MSRFFISASTIVAAPPAEVFELLATPSLHHTFDGSGTLQGEGGFEGRLFLGAEFGMDMKIGANYTSLSTVTEFVENEIIAWQPKGNYTWRYRLEPVEGGTQVTEEWDARRSPRRFMMQLLRFPARNERAIRATLERLAAHFAG